LTKIILHRRSTSQYNLGQPQYSLQSPIGLDRATSVGDLSRPSTGLKRPYKNTHLINGFYQVIESGRV
jgi:hypothetical protein